MVPVVSLDSVSVVRGGNAILAPLDLQIEADQRWVVIGPNGAGKTTLLRLLAAQLHPTTGVAQLLGHRLGRVDVFELRPRIGFAANAQAQQIPPGETVLDAVLTAAYAVTGRWREEYEEVDLRRATDVLEQWRLLDKKDRTVGTLSDGEKKRVQIARAVMTDPELLLLDEPVASLDVGAREQFITLLGDYAASATSPTMVMVTHHLEEIPPGFTHALLLSRQGAVARGPIAETLTSAKLSETFGLPLTVSTRGDRYTAWASDSI